MTAPAPSLEAPAAPARTAPSTIWGLTAADIHDAYWCARGVQCVRRGEGAPPSGAADVYLLLEPGQAALFDLRDFSDELQWTRAELCRVRVIDANEEIYRERVVIGEDGLVKRIARLYGSEAKDRAGGERVLVTERKDVAKAWHAAASRRDAWLALRRIVDLIETLDVRTPGHVYRLGDDDQRLLTDLVNRWADPDRALDGIVELAPGLYGTPNTPLPPDARLIGPLWIGLDGVDKGTVEIGPRVLPDRALPNGTRVSVRPIAEILSPEGRRAARATQTTDEGLYPFLKRAVDATVAATVLLLISPVLLVVAIAVVADDGFPIFFGHRRQTKGGRVFRCWKFRTMRRNAEALARELKALNVCDGPQFFIKDDPRVTKVGKILRKWHLDELPQFWNVLVGDMSLVGPRPSPDGENQYCPAWRELRLSVRPGITGLWQVERTREPGRDFQEWIQYDIEYVRRRSLMLDVQICWKTIANLLRRRPHGTIS